MKLKSVLVFGVVIASLTFVAIAGEKESELKFTGDGYFDGYFDVPTGDQVFFPFGGFDLLDVSHLGESKVVWELRVTPPPPNWPGDPEDPPFTFRSGTFTITGANGKDSLTGIYNGFVITFTSPTTGTYDLEWLFTGGTGRFEDAEGTGHTDGSVNFLTGYAEFEFSGEVKVP